MAESNALAIAEGLHFRYEPRCKICSNHEWGTRVTAALLNRLPYKEIRNRYAGYFTNGLADDALNRHFRKHCDRSTVQELRRLSSARVREAFHERLRKEDEQLVDSVIAFDTIARNCFDDIMMKNQELDWLNDQVEFFSGERIFDVDVLGAQTFPAATLLLADPIERHMRGLVADRAEVIKQFTSRRVEVAKEKERLIRPLIDSLYKREQLLGKTGPQFDPQVLQMAFKAFLDGVIRILYNMITEPQLRKSLTRKIAELMDAQFITLLPATEVEEVKDGV